MAEEYVLEMKNIVKKFPGVVAVDNVNFYLKRGEILGLIGENGAGKSTLMQILSGVYSHETFDGDIFINRKKTTLTSPRDAKENGIEMIYQELDMNLDLTVAENIVIGAWERKTGGIIDWKKCTEKAELFLTKVGLRAEPDKKMRELSTSQQQMAAIAGALSRNPVILIMDEPTDVLSENEGECLYNLIKSLNEEQNVSIILISHKLDEIFTNTHRVVVMRDGKAVGDHDVHTVHHDTVINQMLGKEMDDFFTTGKKPSAPGTEVVFSINNFTVAHPYNPNLNILEDIGFYLKRGEVLGLAGLVGSGRTELLRAIFTGEGRIGGNITVHGSEVHLQSPKDSIEAGLGFLTEERQTDGFIGMLDIIKNLTLANLKAVSRRGLIQFSREVEIGSRYIRDLNIRASGAHVLMNTLSGGNKQKVVLAKWLFTDSDILFLDEPTRGIDIGAKEEIYKLINQMSERGKSLIIISSELPELTALCDRVIVLGKGVIQGELEGEDLNRVNIMKLANALSAC